MTTPITVGIPIYDDVNMLDVTGHFEMFDWAEFDVEFVAAEAEPKRFRVVASLSRVEKSFSEAGQSASYGTRRRACRT
ncbi:hypothetical protein [Rhizobium leguminosarum]|uniref:hypothetical protein n=1 Tax=Rhizobium leguminosarum TaxID=384 RepID=UPI001C92B6AD|nr:hypothetical protein [Rhizobium leguminosarum]MBY2989778.1 hypothetical protein [Rhizobium leguminosarum]